MSDLTYRQRVLLISLACGPKSLESAYSAWRKKTRRSPPEIQTPEKFQEIVYSLERMGMILKRADDKYAITSYGARVATSLANIRELRWAKKDVQFVSNIEDTEANAWIVSLRLASKSQYRTKGLTQPIPVIRATGLEEWSVPASSKEPSTG